MTNTPGRFASSRCAGLCCAQVIHGLLANLPASNAKAIISQAHRVQPTFATHTALAATIGPNRIGLG